jgi:hypothetical protein
MNIDWFGFDFYHADSSSWTGAREAYNAYVYPRLSRRDQRVVPVSLGYNAANLSAQEVSSLDTFCAENARHFLLFGMEDKRVVGTFPFYWHGHGHRNADGSITGGAAIDLLPQCRATYKAIGDIAAAAGPAGTSLDPPLAPPTPGEGGEFVEPKCTGPYQPIPSTWSWCDRSNRTRRTTDFVRRGDVAGT